MQEAIKAVLSSTERSVRVMEPTLILKDRVIRISTVRGSGGESNARRSRERAPAPALALQAYSERERNPALT
jgi:hypothetical protein